MKLSNPSGPSGQRPRAAHPLLGANPATLLAAFRHSGGIPPSSLPLAGAATVSALARWPFTLLEHLWVSTREKRRRELPAPVFIVGHWRSGTTHLYSLLTQSQRFAYVSPLATGLPWDFLVLGRVLRPLLKRAMPANRFIDQMEVRPDSPQEDEVALANMQPLSFFQGLYFPRRFWAHFDAGVFFSECSAEQIKQWQRAARLFLEKVAIDQPGHRVLIKNPVYTSRVDLLKTMWPDAQFIHIYRNPYMVFQSTRHFYRKLLPELALQEYQHLDIDRIVLDTYPRLMDRVLEESRALPAGSFSEVAFEELEQSPLKELKRIYQELGWTTFESDRPAFEAHMEANRGYQKNAYRFPPEDNRKVERHWGYYIQHLGYDRAP